MGKRIGSLKRGVHIDKKDLESNVDAIEKEHGRIEKLGEKLVADNDAIDLLIKKISDSHLSDTDKRAQIRELQAARDALRETYDKDVEEARLDLQQELETEIDRAAEGRDEAKKQSSEVKATKLDSRDSGGGKSLDNAAKAADAQAKEYERIRTESVRNLQNRIDQMNRMRREMMRNKFSGQQ